MRCRNDWWMDPYCTYILPQHFCKAELAYAKVSKIILVKSSLGLHVTCGISGTEIYVYISPVIQEHVSSKDLHTTPSQTSSAFCLVAKKTNRSKPIPSRYFSFDNTLHKYIEHSCLRVEIVCSISFLLPFDQIIYYLDRKKYQLPIYSRLYKEEILGVADEQNNIC